MRKLRIIGNLLMVIGIFVVFSSTVLPLARLPQTLIKKGPVNVIGASQYWIDTFILPIIDEGTTVTVYLRGEHAGGLGITIIPYKEGAPVVGMPPIINYIFETDQETLTAQAKTNMTTEYFVSVVSIRNNYTITISSIWSPFESLRAYLYPGLCLIPAGLLIIYYDRIIEKQVNEINYSVNSK